MFKKIFLSIALTYTVLGFFVLPYVLKSQIVKNIENLTYATVKVDSVYFNPYTFKLRLSGIELSDENKKDLFLLNVLELNIQTSSLLMGSIHIKDLILQRPKLFLAYDKDINFNKIIKPNSNQENTTKEDTSSIPRIIIDKIAIKEGDIYYEDLTKKPIYKTSLRNLDFKLMDIDTKNLTKSDTNLKLSFSIGGNGVVKLSTNILSLDPLIVDGKIDIDSAELYMEYKYVHDKLNLEIADGKLSFGAHYYLNIDDLNATKIDALSLSLDKLRIKPRTKHKDVLNLQNLSINAATIFPFANTVNVGTIFLDGLHLKTVMDKNGKIDWLDYIKTDFASSDVKDEQNISKVKPWNIKIDETVINNSLIEFKNHKSNIYSLKLKSATLAIRADVEGEKTNADIQAAFSGMQLNEKNKLISFNLFKIDNINLDTQKKEIVVDESSLEFLDIQVEKEKDGSINLNDILATKKNKTKKALKSDSEDYRVNLNHFSLKDAKVDFYDKSLGSVVKLGLDNINLDIYDIDSQKDIWSNYTLTSNVNKTGSIYSSGKVGVKPLKQKGTMNLKNISLKEFSPYIEENLFVKLDDGILNLKTNTNYYKSRRRPDLKVNGSLKLNSVLLNDERDGTKIFALDKLDLKSFNYEMFPNRFFVKRADINSFYVNAIINKNKSMNFSTLSKVKEEDANNYGDSNVAEIEKQQPFPVMIMEVNVANGRANFADYSLPIDFKTDIHSLNGVIYAISTLKNETSYVDIDGKVNEYGSTKLKGSLDSGNIKDFLDLDFSFRNLDLHSVTGYSASFAGHEIDEGKLFLDLKYEILNSKLNSSNNMIIKNIKLGAEYKDENTTSLPLGFVIALLEDDDGVIDIDMPIKGDVDNPDFKYGALVMKTFIKLIGSAVTSPFRFLGAIMGIDGDKLSFVEYQGAKSILLPSEKEKLDNIAKMMIKKPKFFLALTPAYDDNLDRWELKREKLIDLVVKEADLENRKNHINVMTIDLLEDIYEDMVKNSDLDDLKENLKEKYEDRKNYEAEYKKVLLNRCVEIQKVSDKELKMLAHSRVKIITDYLVNEKNIDATRLKTKEIKVLNEHESEFVKIMLDIEAK